MESLRSRQEAVVRQALSVAQQQGHPELKA
jgi:hypothetical protein